MEGLRSDTRPQGSQAVHEQVDAAHDRWRASLSALAFPVVVAVAAAAITGVEHTRTVQDDCAVQDDGVRFALSGIRSGVFPTQPS
jgi:hypothetical protein